MEMTNRTPLEGIRILDFSRVLAGPFCTMTLGDLGADIIKIEHPEYGDETRAWGPPWVGDDDPQSAYYLSVNRNKRSLALDLKHPEGITIAKKLIKNSHVLVENFKPGGMAKLGLDYETAHQLNPALVYCSITGFGQTGPFSNRPGYDYIIQAMTGLMSITGPADGEPHKVGVAVSDVFTGLFASNAILAALRHAENTGQGQHIDMALFDSQLAALVNISENYLVSGNPPTRLGNLHPNIVPYQIFSASDGDFVLAVGNDRQFSQLCDLLEQPKLKTDERFKQNTDRVNHREELETILSGLFAAHPIAHWVDLCLNHNIPAGPIHTVAEAIDNARTLNRDMIVETTLPNNKTVELIASPIHLNKTPASLRRPPPSLGQHTQEILATVGGLNKDEIQHLLDQRIVRA
jgi:crotonobetainyl-CoA:carnitine CoA-transferase CaiB-like acyl-CoA transferase